MTREEKQELIDDYYDEKAWLDSWDGGMTSLEWDSRYAALEEYYNDVIKPLLAEKEE